jgi:hypothetical protein
MAITDKKESDGMINVSSIVSHATGEAVIQFTWGEKRAQLTVEEARQHALGVLECAEAGETDAFIVEFFHKELGMAMEKAIEVLRTFRTYRETRREESKQ